MGMENSIPEVRERKGNGKNPFPKFGNGKGMKKSIPIVREWESEAFILGNGEEGEFPLTPAARNPTSKNEKQGCQKVFDVRIL